MTGYTIKWGKMFGCDTTRMTDTRTMVTIRKISFLWIGLCSVTAERVDKKFETQLKEAVRLWAEEGRGLNLGPVADCLSTQILRIAYSNQVHSSASGSQNEKL